MEIISTKRSVWRRRLQVFMYMAWNKMGKKFPFHQMLYHKEDTEGNIVMSITIHPDLFRIEKDNERVKTNITLPV